MARIPEAELERLKSEVSVQRLVEASGVELKKGGKDLLGKCPFHEDDEASLVITPHKNLLSCPHETITCPVPRNKTFHELSSLRRA